MEKTDTKNLITSALGLQDKVRELHSGGVFPGYDVGFQCLSPHYHIKLGCTTYFTGIPTSGKTEFMFEILMNMSEQHGWKHLLFTPESGRPEEIVKEICWKHARMPFDKIPKDQLEEEIKWADKHFAIIDADLKGYSLDEFIVLTEKFVRDYDVQSITIDPWDELEHDFNKYGGREDEYLKNRLSYIRRFAREHHKHFNIVAHPRTPARDKDGNYKSVSAYDLSGGSKWYNKAEAILCTERPRMIDGQPNDNLVIIDIQKAKPKEIGIKGEVELRLDTYKSRYYETDKFSGRKHYAYEAQNNTTPSANNF